MTSSKRHFLRSLTAATATCTAIVLLAVGCDSGSDSSSSRPSAEAGEGVVVVLNETSRDFAITFTGSPVLSSNEVISTVSQPMLVTNVTTATDGMTLVTNVVNTPINGMSTNVVLETTSPEPITREARRLQTTAIPLPANTYNAVFQVQGGIRGGETSLIVREGGRTRVNVLLNPNNDTGLQLTVSQ